MLAQLSGWSVCFLSLDGTRCPIQPIYIHIYNDTKINFSISCDKWWWLVTSFYYSRKHSQISHPKLISEQRWRPKWKLRVRFPPSCDVMVCQSCALPPGVTKLVPWVQWGLPHTAWFIVIDMGVVRSCIFTAGLVWNNGWCPIFAPLSPVCGAPSVPQALVCVCRWGWLCVSIIT